MSKESPWRRGDAADLASAPQTELWEIRTELFVFGPVCCRTPQACHFFQDSIYIGNPYVNGSTARISKSQFCDRFLGRLRGRRRPRGAAGDLRTVALRHTTLGICPRSHRGGGETLRTSQARPRQNCGKSGRNSLHAGIVVLFAVELHRRAIFSRIRFIKGFPM